MIKLQNQYKPDSVTPPGETLLELLEERSMSQTELAERMGRPKKTISEIVNAKAAITPDTALQLENVFGVPAHFWMHREQDYQESLARGREHERLAQQIEWLKSFPVKEMIKRGWIEDKKAKLENFKAVLSFFGMASPEQWEKYWSSRAVAYRKSTAVSTNKASVITWLRQGELLAEKIDCEPYNASKFKKALETIRTLTTESFEVARPKIVALCAEAGVAVVFVAEMPKMGVSGVTRWLSSSKALIQLSLRYKRDDSFWFTFFHEGKHVLQENKDEMFFAGDEGVAYDPDAPMEREANAFSANFLIPEAEFKRFVAASGNRYSKAEIVQFSSRLNIAPGIVVGRLQHEEHLLPTHCNDLKQKYELNCA
jgi:HTH-type transcriptional regulator / antitoxin HigA